MSSKDNWDNMSKQQKEQFKNNKESYLEFLKREDEKNKLKKGSDESSLSNPSLEQPFDNKTEEKMSLDMQNQINRSQLMNKGIVMINLKPNQMVFEIDFSQINLKWDENDDEKFNKILSKDNQFKKPEDFAKTKDPKVVMKIFETIFSDEDTRYSLKYLCSFAVGGKFKDDRKKMNKRIQECLVKANIFPYGGKHICGYNGLLKLAPKMLADIRKSTLKEGKHPKDNHTGEWINYYATGFESNFDYDSLQLMKCNQAAINYCYTRLLLSIDLINKKRNKGDNDMKLIKRLATFTLGYTVPDYLSTQKGVIRLVNFIKDLDLKGSDINFDIFGYQ
jgi:hypothetical protein